jgi:hypothetical protein
MSAESLPTFQRNVLPPSPESKSEPHKAANRGSMFLQVVGMHLPDFTVSYPRR